MQRDWLLGFPPVLLAQDAPVRQQFVTPPRPPACVDARSGAVIDKAETAALDKSSAYDEGTFTVSSAPVGAEFAPAGQSAYTADTGASLGGTVATDPQPGASPISLPGVWRKTAEHKPPKVGAYVARFEDCENTACDAWWDGGHWHYHGSPQSPRASLISLESWQWLDTYGEFKVGDLVRVTEDGGGAVKPGDTGVIVDAHGGRYLKIDGRAELWAWDADWLEHA